MQESLLNILTGNQLLWIGNAYLWGAISQSALFAKHRRNLIDVCETEWETNELRSCHCSWTELQFVRWQFLPVGSDSGFWRHTEHICLIAFEISENSHHVPVTSSLYRNKARDNHKAVCVNRRRLLFSDFLLSLLPSTKWTFPSKAFL